VFRLFFDELQRKWLNEDGPAKFEFPKAEGVIEKNCNHLAFAFVKTIKKV